LIEKVVSMVKPLQVFGSWVAIERFRRSRAKGSNVRVVKGQDAGFRGHLWFRLLRVRRRVSGSKVVLRIKSRVSGVVFGQGCLRVKRQGSKV
jgi:hypothetical protein